jgi:large subunit ribosomal protein L28
MLSPVIQPLTIGRRCALCNKGPIRGDQITRRGLAKSKGGVGRKITGRSHRSFKPNLQKVRAVVDGKTVRLKVCTSCIRLGRVQKPAQKLA